MSPHALTANGKSQMVRRLHASAAVAAVGADLFAMLDRQAGMVVKLAGVVGEVLQGKESAHSLRLHDLEQSREELQRRSLAALRSMPNINGGVDDMYRTMESLNRGAAGLFQAARGFHQMFSGRNEATGKMMIVIQKAAANLQRGYARLGNGSLIAEPDADAAMAGKSALRKLRVLGLHGRPEAGNRAAIPSRERISAHRDGTFPGSAFSVHDLHETLDGIAQEIAVAGGILKRWARQQSAGLNRRNSEGEAGSANASAFGKQWI